jgi:hypothetical protein
MTNKMIKFICDVCRNQYQHGLHHYEGHKLELYGNIFCCDICWKGNGDGWAPVFEKVLTKTLTERDLPIPKRNEIDLLPRN